MRRQKPNRLAARLAAAALAFMAFGPAAPSAFAQTESGAGFNVDSDKPIHIEADELEVLDEQGKAIFTGNVVAEQDGTTLRTIELTVFYAGGAMKRGAGDEKPKPEATGSANPPQQSISRLEANGKVVVTTADQQATGDKAVFQMKENTVTMTGDVVLTQGGNVLRGTELVVNLDTGRSKLVSNEGSGQPGRVTGLFAPGSASEPGAPPSQ